MIASKYLCLPGLWTGPGKEERGRGVRKQAGDRKPLRPPAYIGLQLLPKDVQDQACKTWGQRTEGRPAGREDLDLRTPQMGSVSNLAGGLGQGHGREAEAGVGKVSETP